MTERTFRLGRDPATRVDVGLPPHHFVTHAAAFGMTGSGKTGLCIALVEEALRNRVPVLMLDIKGDLGNLALLFPDQAPASFLPWIDADAARREGKDPAVVAEETATRWREGLAGWGLGENDLRALREGTELRIITPGTSAGEPLHVLSPLEQRSDLWDLDEEAARESLSAALSLLLRMVEREADPTRGREHVLLAHLCERRLRAGEGAGLEAILADLQSPPIDRVGALAVDEFLPPKERANLAKDLNALIASPTFSTWRQGAPLDVAAWLQPKDPKKVPAVIVSVAHLDDAERMLVLSLVLEQTLAYVRGLSGTTDLRSLVLYGARAELAQAQVSAPGGLETVGAVFLGRGAVNRAMARSDKAQTRIQKLTAKAADAEAALGEAVAKRNHEIATKEAELAQAGTATTERVVLPKKDALVVERYAVVWVAR